MYERILMHVLPMHGTLIGYVDNTGKDNTQEMNFSTRVFSMHISASYLAFSLTVRLESYMQQGTSVHYGAHSHIGNTHAELLLSSHIHDSVSV